MNGYDEYAVGDRVYCLAWIGKGFEVVAKDDQQQKISLRGDTASEPGGAELDIFSSTSWMLSHTPRDDIWSWTDRAGETYVEVVERFRTAHQPGKIVTGYLVEGLTPLEPEAATPERAMALRLVAPVDSMILVQPMVGLTASGTEVFRQATDRTDVRWIEVGPVTAARIGMTGYRWSIAFGDIILNAQDFCDVRSQ